MKKQLFDLWYDKSMEIEFKSRYELTDTKTEDVPKFARRKARKMFSSVYDLISAEYKKRVKSISKNVMNASNEMVKDYNTTLKQHNNIEKEIKILKSYMTELYDGYIAKKIDKDIFEKQKSFYGNKLLELKKMKAVSEHILKTIKKQQKYMESLMVVKGK